MKAPMIYVVYDIRSSARDAVGWCFDYIEAHAACKALGEKAGNQWAFTVDEVEPLGDKSETRPPWER